MYDRNKKLYLVYKLYTGGLQLTFKFSHTMSFIAQTVMSNSLSLGYQRCTLGCKDTLKKIKTRKSTRSQSCISNLA